MDWERPLKLLNIQLKIQLTYSRNDARIGVGKTTIICRNRACWHTWMKETSQHRTPLGCRTQGYRQAVHLVGGKPRRSGGKPWEEAAAGGFTTYWEMDCMWERMMHISPYWFLLWCYQLDTTPAERNISSQAHQKKLQLPKRPLATAQNGTTAR